MPAALRAQRARDSRAAGKTWHAPPRPSPPQGLALFQGGVLMVSHDQHLIESTVDELWAVENGTGGDRGGDDGV